MLSLPKELPPLLVTWFKSHARSLPWRQNADPYRVWLSEIMLQQTRVEAVIPYYERFLAAFPTIEALAHGDDARLMKCWEGLGYYSRAKNLKAAALQITERFGGVFPQAYEDILSLPGIGPYTAGAIGSIAFGLPTPAVDGNVLRILARLCKDKEDVLSPTVKNKYQSALKEIYPKGHEAGAFTQAFMELGQTVCLPNGTPKCRECPLYSLCRSKDGAFTSIPYRAPKKERKIQEKTVFLFLYKDTFALHLRDKEGLLGNLWEFPNAEGYLFEDDIFAYAEGLGLSPLGVKEIGESKHIFTHLEWHMRGFLVPCQSKGNGDFVFATAKDVKDKYAIASAFRFFKQFVLQEK